MVQMQISMLPFMKVCEHTYVYVCLAMYYVSYREIEFHSKLTSVITTVGPRVHLGKDSTRITQADGTSSEYPNTYDVSQLPPDIQDLVKRAKEVRKGTKTAFD